MRHCKYPVSLRFLPINFSIHSLFLACSSFYCNACIVMILFPSFLLCVFVESFYKEEKLPFPPFIYLIICQCELMNIYLILCVITITMIIYLCIDMMVPALTIGSSFGLTSVCQFSVSPSFFKALSFFLVP